MAATKTPILQDVVSDDFNYELWARIAKTRLVEKELWAVVENGIPPKPAAAIQAEDLSKWRDFVIKDSKALQILESSLPDSVSRLTLETDSAKDLWDSLKEANEQSKLGCGEEVRLEEGERISSSLLDRVMEIADPRLKSKYLAITKTVISLSDSYDQVTDELIVMGLKELSFKRFRGLIDLMESTTVGRTLYGNLKLNKYVSSHYCEGFIRWLNSMSDSYTGTPLSMEEVIRVKDMTFNTCRELLDLFDSVPVEANNGFMKGFELGSSSCIKEVCYSPNDLRGFLKVVKLVKQFEQVEMKEGERISSASESKQDCSPMGLKREMRSRHERGECIQCGGKGHVFKDCTSNRENQRRNEAFNARPVMFDKDVWMIYTNTSHHMTPYEKFFTTLDRSQGGSIKRLGSGDSIICEGMGNVTIMTKEGKKKKIKDVLFVPKIGRNVLSVGQMKQAGYGIVMSANKCTIKDQSGRLFGESMREDRGDFFMRLKVVEGKSHL